MGFFRRREPLHAAARARGRADRAPASRVTRARLWQEPGVTGHLPSAGVGRGRHRRCARGGADAVLFVSLPDGSLLVEEGPDRLARGARRLRSSRRCDRRIARAACAAARRCGPSRRAGSRCWSSRTPPAATRSTSPEPPTGRSSWRSTSSGSSASMPVLLQRGEREGAQFSDACGTPRRRPLGGARSGALPDEHTGSTGSGRSRT